MLTRIDRVQIVVPDRQKAMDGWIRLLDAEPAADDKIACLGALRSRIRIGNGWVEFLEPDGAGPVQDALSQRGAHLFSAGAATSDFDGLISHFRSLDLEPQIENGQAYIDPAAKGHVGVRTVISEDVEEETVGLISFFYETTLLVEDGEKKSHECARIFDLNTESFVRITSEKYGYSGTLTLFHPDRLHRYEMIEPFDMTKTMGRFFTKMGESYYMAYAESAHLDKIEQRAINMGAGHTLDPARDGSDDFVIETLFLHPGALGGMMLGLSRPTRAWMWSGHPERVIPAK